MFISNYWSDTVAVSQKCYRSVSIDRSCNETISLSCTAAIEGSSWLATTHRDQLNRIRAAAAHYRDTWSIIERLRGFWHVSIFLNSERKLYKKWKFTIYIRNMGCDGKFFGVAYFLRYSKLAIMCATKTIFICHCSLLVARLISVTFTFSQAADAQPYFFCLRSAI